jgi:hypothetical protein
LRQQLRKARHNPIAAYAAEIAGMGLDLDADLEAAGIEGSIKAAESGLIGSSRLMKESSSTGPGTSQPQS